MSIAKHKRNDVQGLRALAVISVMLFHIDESWLSGGFIGVDIFFVISGFVITSLITKQDKSFSFLSFYGARIKRIVPAYLSVLIATTILASFLFVPEDNLRFLKSLRSSLMFLSNNYFGGYQDYFSPKSYELPLLHTWSLSVEMQFYLFLPLLLVFINRKYLVKALVCLIIATLLITQVQLLSGKNISVYFSLLARIPEFLIGCLVAIFPKYKGKFNEHLALIGIIFVTSSLYFINSNSTFPGLLSMPVCIGTALVIYANNSRVNLFFSNRFLVFIGDLSYSLYLWHWVVFSIYRYVLQSYKLSILEIIICFFVTFITSYVSYKCIENPFRKLECKKFIIKFSPVCLCLVVIYYFSESINDKYMTLMPEAWTRYADESAICNDKIIGECIRGDKIAQDEILLIGDSHAAQLNIFADLVGKATKTKIRVITASSCVTIPTFDMDGLPDWSKPACELQIKEVEKHLMYVNTIILAGMWQHHAQRPLFLKALHDFLSKNKKPVIVLAQVPMLNQNIQRSLRLQKFGISNNITLDPLWHSSNLKIQEITEQFDNAKFIDISRWELFSNPPFYKDDIIYKDNNHLNEVGSRKLGEFFQQYLYNHHDNFMFIN